MDAHNIETDLLGRVAVQHEVGQLVERVSQGAVGLVRQLAL
jgi:hypothetical protein